MLCIATFTLQVLEKKAKAEKLLEELDRVAESQKPEVDMEGITEEQRYMLRKVGLRMKAFLLMGELHHHNLFSPELV